LLKVSGIALYGITPTPYKGYFEGLMDVDEKSNPAWN
jgi:hypothetical protein